MITSVTQERSRFAVQIVKHASKALLSPFFKINIRGTHNIPEKGSFVLLPKHQRWEDIPLIAISIGEPVKGDNFGSAHELFNFAMHEIADLSGCR